MALYGCTFNSSPGPLFLPADFTTHILVCFRHTLFSLYIYVDLSTSAASPRRLYEKLLKVAEKGHQKALEKVGYGMLFGDYMNQNINKAKEIFETLAVEGSPKAQTVLTLWNNGKNVESN